MSLPHIKNSKAGINRQEPWYKNLFEVYFTIPAALQSEIGSDDVNVLTEQVKTFSGMDSLTKSPETAEQTYMGSTRTYLGSGLSGTSHDLSMEIQLNMRNGVDNYIFKLFKKWNSLGYDPSTGKRALKDDYVADFIRVVQFNKAGDIFKDVTYHDVMLTGMTGNDDLDYSVTTDLRSLTLTFKSDWADDEDA